MIRAASPGEQTTSILAVAVQRAGLRRGSQAAAMVAAWAIAEHELGHELGEDGSLSAAVREYAAWWKQSERTAWRELQAFKAAFPEEGTPGRLAGLLHDVANTRRQEAVFTAPVLAVA